MDVNRKSKYLVFDVFFESCVTQCSGMKTCYTEEHELPVDVRGSKTSVLNLSNKKNISRWREDMNFMFSWQKQNLTSERSELVRYYSCHLNKKFMPSRHRVISSIYNLRHSDFSVPRYNTVTYGKHSLRYLGRTLWRKLRAKNSSATSLASFKNCIRKRDLSSLLDNECRGCYYDGCRGCAHCNSQLFLQFLNI